MTVNFNYKILIFMCLAGLVLLFIIGIPDSILSKLSSAEDYDKIHSLYQNMNLNFNMKSSFEEKKEDLMFKINESNIDIDIMQDKIINVLSNISKKNNIELSNIKFSDIIPVFIDNSNSDEALETDSDDNNAVCMNVTVDFDSDFNDMLSFVDDIKNSETDISVTDISILLLESDKVHVMISLIFYALPLNHGR